MAVINTNVPAAPRYQPELIDPAYDDPNVVRHLVEQAGPFVDDRGVQCARPMDYLTDPEWVDTLNATYGFAGIDADA